MAAEPRRTVSDVVAPVPFSYAQAAKGLSAAPTSSAAASKPSSGSATPAKDLQSSTNPGAGVMNWADDAEVNENHSDTTTSSREPRTQSQTATSKVAITSQASSVSIVSSPDLGSSSASTVTKDDDVSSLPNSSSESTWENKSQASTTVEKSVESTEKNSEKPSEKGKRKNAERAPTKPLQDAPIPMVNIWKQRAENAKAKTKAAPAKPAAAVSTGLPNGASQASALTSKQAKAATADNNDQKEKASISENKVKTREEEKGAQVRKDSRPEVDSDKAKKGTRNRPHDKEAKSAPASFPLPPDRDQEAWPTPETALDEDRKKASEKTEKERKDGSAAKPSGKKEWVNMAITPNVIFNTPLPNSAGSRRGGRGAGRGGAQGGGRSSGFNASGPGHAEKDGSTPTAVANGDQLKRGRSDGATRDASPKGRRTTSTGSPPSKDKVAASSGEKFSKAAASEVEASSGRAPVSELNTQVPGQNNTFPRQYPPRPAKGRRGEFPVQDRRKDGDSVSPTKENGTITDRQSSTTPQTDVLEDGERRPSTYADGQASHQSKRGTNDRQFGSFSSRDRARGGARGGRGNYQNSHQFSNGHVPSIKSSSTFSGPLSPTSFNPDQNTYFAPPSRFRNAPRSQSVTTESMYRMPGQYGGSQQLPPIQTYMGGMYEYPLVQPMSAVPFGQFGMDHYTLFSMVTTQLEYYFSVENLCKDMYLRKHMDTKGFVFLSFIADFNRIKSLTTDTELIKLVCFQSAIIEFRIGHDGKDRLRRREGWEQWVLPVPQRDVSAQNEGPEELYNPPIPHPHGFDPNGLPRYPDMPTGSPTGPVPFGNEGSFPAAVNGFHPGASQHVTMSSNDKLTNGTSGEGVNGTAIPNGHPIDTSTKAVSGEPDSFSDEQVESLTVVVRKQEQSRMPALPPSTTRTFSNGSLDSRSDAPNESEMTVGRQANVKTNGTDASLGVESKAQDQPQRTMSPFAPATAMTPVRLYWVKDNDAPVDFVPADSTHESYFLLRSKALQQRQNSAPGCCPYDMDVLYQFWSHFLIRNFNTRMYDEFRQFAFEDAANNYSEVGLTNLIKFYGESLLSSQTLIRERVARDYIDLVHSENEHQRPAFIQLRTAFCNSALNPRNRKRIGEYLDAELKASLE